MKFTMRVCLLFLVLLLVSATTALGERDPELEQCQHQCRVQQQYGEEEKGICARRCEEYHREKQRHQGRGGSGELDNHHHQESPEERLRQCERTCRQKHGEQVAQCHVQCQREFEREQREERERGRGHGGEKGPGQGGVGNEWEPEQEYSQCRERCTQQGGRRRQQCESQCEKERGEREREQRGRGQGQREREREREREEGGRGVGNERDPQQEYRQCRDKCMRQEGYRQQQCLSQCEQQRRESEREQQSRGRGQGDITDEMELQQEGRQLQNPYVFEDRHYITGMQTQHGRVRILQNFVDRSMLLRGVENYRVTILEADPQTFVLPNHWDADVVIFVARGTGSVSMVRQNRRESFNVRQGDIFRIRAGTTTYLINRDNNERLVMVKLLQPVSTPGRFEAFFAAGGENPESVFRAFSNEILEAAFNTRGERLQRIFGQQREGVIIKASQEQIRSMSHHEEGGIWPFSTEHKGTVNIYEQRPTHSNQYGQLYEVNEDQFRSLRDLDVSISFANITEGAMTAPYYNSKATQIAVVVNGEGYFEMACPHLARIQQGRQQERGESWEETRGSRQERGGSKQERGESWEEHRGSQQEYGGSQQERGESWQEHGGSQRQTTSGPSYQRVSSPLRRGTVVVVPAGHPFVAVASNNQNLQVICFEVNARNNEKYPLAGRRNVINQIEDIAKELAFGVPAREVNEVFRSQQEEFFFRGPRQQQQGRADM